MSLLTRGSKCAYLVMVKSCARIQKWLRALSCLEGLMPQISPADRLRHLAHELETLADHVERPSLSSKRSELLIAEGERIAQAVWGVFRGGR